MSHEVIQPQEQEASELKSPYEKAYLDTADHYNKNPHEMPFTDPEVQQAPDWTRKVDVLAERAGRQAEAEHNQKVEVRKNKILARWDREKAFKELKHDDFTDWTKTKKVLDKARTLAEMADKEVPNDPTNWTEFDTMYEQLDSDGRQDYTKHVEELQNSAEPTTEKPEPPTSPSTPPSAIKLEWKMGNKTNPSVPGITIDWKQAPTPPPGSGVQPPTVYRGRATVPIVPVKGTTQPVDHDPYGKVSGYTGDEAYEPPEPLPVSSEVPAPAEENLPPVPPSYNYDDDILPPSPAAPAPITGSYEGRDLAEAERKQPKRLRTTVVGAGEDFVNRPKHDTLSMLPVLEGERNPLEVEIQNTETLLGLIVQENEGAFVPEADMQAAIAATTAGSWQNWGQILYDRFSYDGKLVQAANRENPWAPNGMPPLNRDDLELIKQLNGARLHPGGANAVRDIIALRDQLNADDERFVYTHWNSYADDAENHLEPKKDGPEAIRGRGDALVLLFGGHRDRIPVAPAKAGTSAPPVPTVPSSKQSVVSSGEVSNPIEDFFATPKTEAEGRIRRTGRRVGSLVGKTVGLFDFRGLLRSDQATVDEYYRTHLGEQRLIPGRPSTPEKQPLGKRIKARTGRIVRNTFIADDDPVYR